MARPSSVGHCYGDPVGPLATVHREPGQARKGAAAAVIPCAGVWLAGLPPKFRVFALSDARTNRLSPHPCLIPRLTSVVVRQPIECPGKALPAMPGGYPLLLNSQPVGLASEKHH